MAPPADDPTISGAARLRAVASRAGRSAAAPVLRYFNRRFHDVHVHLEQHDAALDRTLTEQRRLAQQSADSAETASELTLMLQRFAERFAERVEEVLVSVARTAGASSALPGTPMSDARSVQLAHALSIIPSLPGSGRVLVVDEDAVPVASALAGLGVEVTALGCGDAPESVHPGVRLVGDTLAAWAGPSEPFDLALVRSDASTIDAEAVDRIGDWLTGDGELQLTLSGVASGGPSGQPEEEALPRWKSGARRGYVRRDRITWVLPPEGAPAELVVVRLTVEQ